MPLIKVECSEACQSAKKAEVVKNLSKILSSVTGKPEKYSMAVLRDDVVISFAGEIAKAAFVEVRGIGGLGPAVNKKLSAEICKYLNSALGIESANIYINFTDIAASNWGWDGATFG